MRICIEVVSGVEGPSLYINSLRVAGPKPWGGGKTIATWGVDKDKFFKDLKFATGGS